MKAEERREQILRCAGEAFGEKGYHETSVSDIVSRAGVARGTFYQYFNDKRSIFDELVDRYMAEIRDRIVRIDPSLGVEEGLRLLRQNVRGVLGVMLEQRNRTKIFLAHAVGLDPEADEKLLKFYADVTALLERSLTLGQEMGIVRPCNVNHAAIFVIGALKELMYRVTMRDYEPDVEELVEEFLTLFRTGLLRLE